MTRVSSLRALSIRVLAVLTVATLALSVAAPVSAQESDAQKILELLSSANDKFNAEDYRGAVQAYEEAYALYPDPSLLYRLGLSSEKTEQYYAAVDYYEQFIDAVPDDKTAKKVKARLDELRAKLPARVIVETDPWGATIYLGSVESPPIGETPDEVNVEAGEVSVIVKLKGYETEVRTVETKRGVKTRVKFDLVETVYFEEVEPPVKTPVAKKASPLKTWGWISTGTGLALLGTGGVFTMLSQGKEDDVNTYNKSLPGSSPGELQSLKDDANSYYDTSVLFYLAGSVVTATGVTLIVLDSMEETETEGTVLRLDAAPTRGGAWLGLSGQF